VPYCHLALIAAAVQTAKNNTKRKKSDMGDETLSSDLSPSFNIEQSP